MFISNLIHGDVALCHEEIRTRPTVSGLDPEVFHRYEAGLRFFRAGLDIDTIDDIYMPKHGFQIRAEYEGSYRRLDSPLSYESISVSGDFYTTIASDHTLRLFVFAGRSTPLLPLYKHFNLGRPETFVGMRYDQLLARQLELARVEYRLQVQRFLYARLIGNAAFDLRTAEDAAADNVYGFGAGITFAYPLGSLEIILSRGHTDFSRQRRMRNTAYISIGAKF